MSDTNNGTRKKKRFPLKINVGLVVYTVIALYLVINLILYVTRDHISFSEVEYGRIEDSDTFTGLALRSDSVVYASEDGYVSYYVNDSERAAKGGNVCMLAQNGSSSDSTDIASSMTSSDYSDIQDQVSNFNTRYSESDYKTVSSLHYQVGNIYSRIVSRSNIDSLESSHTDNSSYSIMKAAQAGIISYTIDGLEGTAQSDVTADLVSGSAEEQRLAAGSYVKAGEPVYKIITDDTWQIVIQPDEDQLARFEDTDTVNVTFNRDGVETEAKADVFSSGGTDFVSLTFSNYLVRYCDERYLDITVNWGDYEGLKIPESSVVTKDFLKIPADFLVTNDNTQETGLEAGSADQPVLIKPSIYRLSGDEDYIYVDPNDSALEGYSQIINAEDGSTYGFTDLTAPLEGVYCINSGYTQFRIVEILYKYGDYCIINENTANGISLYDRIVLDGSSVSEGQVIAH